MTIRDMRNAFTIGSEIIVIVKAGEGKGIGFLEKWNEQKYIDRKITFMYSADDYICIELESD